MPSLVPCLFGHHTFMDKWTSPESADTFMILYVCKGCRKVVKVIFDSKDDNVIIPLTEETDYYFKVDAGWPHNEFFYIYKSMIPGVIQKVVPDA